MEGWRKNSVSIFVQVTRWGADTIKEAKGDDKDSRPVALMLLLGCRSGLS